MEREIGSRFSYENRSASFLPKLIRQAMKADTEAVLEAFGKNEQTKKVFWALFTATAGLVLAQVVDPAAAQAILAAITGAGI